MWSTELWQARASQLAPKIAVGTCAAHPVSTGTAESRCIPLPASSGPALLLLPLFAASPEVAVGEPLSELPDFAPVASPLAEPLPAPVAFPEACPLIAGLPVVTPVLLPEVEAPLSAGLPVAALPEVFSG